MKMPEEPFDPRLEAALEEIKLILKKYDIGACIQLAGQHHTEFFYELSPTWSCITMRPEPDGTCFVRFKAATATGGPVEKERAIVSTGLVFGLHSLAGRETEDMLKIMMMLAQHFDIEHQEGFTPHRPPPPEGD